MLKKLSAILAIALSVPAYSQPFSNSSSFIKVKHSENNIVKSDAFVTKIVSLVNREAADIYKLVKNLNLNIELVYDLPTNSIVIMGDKNQVDKAEALCKSLDSMPVLQNSSNASNIIKGMKYITKTYELEHANFEEVEQELNAIIDRNNSALSESDLNDKDGKLPGGEYFLLNRKGRIAIVHTSPEKFAVIDEYFEAINKPLPQVLIEASIIAVDDGLEKQLGIKWNGLDGTAGYFGPQKTKEEDTNPLASLMGGGGDEGDDGHNGDGKTSKSLRDHFKYGGTWDFSSVNALLKAVETDGKSEVLSRPRIMTVTGETSCIHFGDEIPYTSGSTVTDGGNITSSVEFKQVGIKLDVTPTVNKKDNTINMKVIPEVSQYVRDVVMGNNRVPQVATRRAESTIKIQNGETIVIGGLIETRLLRQINKIPILGSLPLIGKAFRNKTNSNSKTNLVILLTAHILNDRKGDNTLSPNAVKEINRIKSLRESKALKEISEPLVKKPAVYGKDIELEDDSQKEENTVNNEIVIDYENQDSVFGHLENKLEEIKKNMK